MEQFILMFGLDKDKEKAVRTVCSRIGAVPVTVERRDYSQKLGTLAGVQGFSRDKTVYSGPNFPAEMLVFSGMNSTQVDVFLDSGSVVQRIAQGASAYVKIRIAGFGNPYFLEILSN